METIIQPQFAPWDVVYYVYDSWNLDIIKFLITWVRYTWVNINDEWVNLSDKFVYDWYYNLWWRTNIDWFMWMEKKDVLETYLYKTKEEALKDLEKSAQKITKEIKKLNI